MVDLKQTKYMRELRRRMAETFELDELQALAFDLMVDWRELSAGQKFTGAQALIRYLAERGRLSELLTLLGEERPQIDWPEVPPAAQQIRDVQSTIPDPLREKALQEYLEQMRRHVVDKRSNQDTDYPAADVATARAYTNQAWPCLDKSRRLIAARFLGEVELSFLINFRQAELIEADLQDANLQKADLCQADLRWANLRGANLSESNLANADLRQANLRKADLREADLGGADLRGASMGGANLSGARLKGAMLPTRYTEWLQKHLEPE
jgi:hypothetical protein